MADLKTDLAECVRLVERAKSRDKWTLNSTLSDACIDFIHDHGDELLAAVEDAERYRWLRDNCYINRHDGREFPHAVIAVCLGPEKDGKHIGWMRPGHRPGVGIPSLDTAIDAARVVAGNGGGDG